MTRSAACLIVRNEEADIAEWLVHHHLIGFDMLIVYDHQSTDRTAAVIRSLARDIPITLHAWQDTSKDRQNAAYRDCLQRHGAEFDWIGFLDADEFLIGPPGERIQTLLATNERAAGIALNWLIFGTTGHAGLAGALVLQSLTRRGSHDFEVNRHVKSIIRPGQVRRVLNPHAFELDGATVHPNGAAVQWERPGIVAQGTAMHDCWRVHHYFLRSAEHWQRRLARGQLGAEARHAEQFSLYDRNEIEDRTALPHAIRVQAFLAHRAADAASPILCVLDRVDNDTASGWAFDRSAPEETINFAAIIDGFLVATVAADQPRPDLGQAGYPVQSGFSFRIPRLFQDGRSHRLELLNDNRAFPFHSHVGMNDMMLAAHAITGFIDRLQPDCVEGWMHDALHPSVPISFSVLIDGSGECFEVASIHRADVLASGCSSAHVGFHVKLPKTLQDGQPHGIAFFHEDGSELLLCDPHTATWSNAWIIPATTQPTAASSVVVTVDRLAEGIVAGWAYNEAAVMEPARLDMMIDGQFVESLTADIARADVLHAGHPHALVGYTQTIPSRFCDDRDHTLSWRGSGGAPVCSATGVAAPDWHFRFARTQITGQVDGLQEGAIRGWVLLHDHVAERRTGGLSVLVTHRGQPIAQLTANRFRADVAETHDCDPNCGFSFVPAIELVAGRALDLRFRVLPDGPELQGSPYTACFPALESFRQVREMLSVADTLFTQMWALRSQLKAMLPAEQHSLASYDAWARSYQQALAARPATDFADTPLISVICPAFRPRLADFRAAVQSVIAQTYRNWELIIVDDCSQRPELDALINELAASDPRIRTRFLAENAGISGATNAAIAQVQGTHVAFFDHDDLMAPRALELMLAAAQRHRALLLYCDEDKIDDFGCYSEVNFKPDWNHRFLLAQNYVCHLLFVDAATLRAAGPLRRECDGAQDHDMILRLSELIPPEQIHHVPEVLYHWRKTPTSTASSGKSKSYAVQAGIRAVSEHLQRLGVDAEVSSPFDATFYAVKWRPTAWPKVTIIIPFREHIALTRACLAGIVECTDYPSYEIVLVDNWSTSAESDAFARDIAGMDNVRIIRVERAFNYSELNNIAVAATESEMLLFLNNDVFVRQPNWLEQMVGETQADPKAAIVGIKLLYPNGLVQHAGVILGVGGIADHAHRGLTAQDPGYMARAICAQELSAVTAACMLCRRDVFDQVGGFDAEHLQVAFNDVDLCLKVGAAGWRVVWTPHVTAEHRESLSRGSDFKPEHQARFFAENQGDRGFSVI
eukprot:gene5957-6028_t